MDDDLAPVCHDAMWTFAKALNNTITGKPRNINFLLFLKLMDKLFGVIIFATTMKVLKCKPSAQFAYSYSINVLSKYSSLISHRPSKVDTSTIDLRRSTHQSPIFEGRHVDHRSSKVNTSISEGRHIDLRKSTIDLRKSPHRSSIFESRYIDIRRSKVETSHLQFVTEYCPQLRS